MSMHDKPDREVEGQLDLAHIYKPPERLVAVSKIFARARKEMSLAEQKTFVYALTQLNFKDVPETNYVRLDKKTLAEILGIHSDPDHLSVDLFENIRDLWKHSHITIRERDLDLYASGAVVSSIVMFKNVVRIRFCEDYLPLFTNLSKDYITMWSADIFGMNSLRSVQFYEFLREITDTREKVNSVLLGIKAIKEMFNIPMNGPGSYMRGEQNHFDRTNFEKKVIDPVCEDLNKSRMIQLMMNPDGKLYEKVKRGNKVYGYRFYWMISTHPGVATAAEAFEIKEQGEKDPQVLKVAQDIVKGKKKPKKKSSAHNFIERDDDYSDLIRAYYEDGPLPGQFRMDMDGNITEEGK